MILSGIDNMNPPRVIRKRNRRGDIVHVGMFMGDARYYLTPAEAISLADRLVDTAEEVLSHEN